MKRLRIGRNTQLAVLMAVLVIAVAVPMTTAGEKDHGYLGIYMQDLTREVRRGLDIDVEKGVLISGVEDGTPAEKAGLEDGDVIITFNGTEIGSSDELSDLVRAIEPGTTVKLELIRDGKNKTIEVTLSEWPEDFGMKWKFGNDFNFTHDFDFSHDFNFKFDGNHFLSAFGGPKLGINVSELNEDLGSYFKADTGVLVLNVNEDSMAEDAGVKAGDVITAINDEEIKEIGDIHDTLSDIDEGDEFRIVVNRKGKKKSLKTTMTEKNNFRVFTGHMPRMFKRHHNQGTSRILIEHDDDLRREMDELREELRELKRDLESRDG